MKNLLCTVFLLAAAAQPARSAVYVSDSFAGTSANDRTFVNGMGDGLALTAASGIDLDGEGWLQRTQDDNNQSSFVNYNQAIPTAGGPEKTPNSIANRDAATVHSARIDIESDKTVSILWETEDEEEWTALTDEYQCHLAYPENIPTAGTGSSTSNQEVRNISVASIPEQLSVTLILGVGCALLTGRRLFSI